MPFFNFHVILTPCTVILGTLCVNIDQVIIDNSVLKGLPTPIPYGRYGEQKIGILSGFVKVCKQRFNDSWGSMFVLCLKILSFYLISTISCHTEFWIESTFQGKLRDSKSGDGTEGKSGGREAGIHITNATWVIFFFKHFVNLSQSGPDFLQIWSSTCRWKAELENQHRGWHIFVTKSSKYAWCVAAGRAK